MDGKVLISNYLIKPQVLNKHSRGRGNKKDAIVH